MNVPSPLVERIVRTLNLPALFYALAIQWVFSLTPPPSELTADDVRNTSSKYWELHSDPIMPMDGAAGSLISIHYNLAVGTFARYTKGRPDVEALLHRLLTFQVL